MMITIPFSLLSPDEINRVWTDDEDLSDADPVADHAAFVAYLHADEDEPTDGDRDLRDAVLWRMYNRPARNRSVLCLDTMHGH